VRQTHYNWLEDPNYRTAFEDAWKRAADTLEAEAVRRAHDGIRKAIRYKGKIVGYETEYSDTLLLALLKSKKADEYRERSTVEMHGARDKPPLTVNVIYTDK
jgi:hypothetical protein